MPEPQISTVKLREFRKRVVRPALCAHARSPRAKKAIFTCISSGRSCAFAETRKLFLCGIQLALLDEDEGQAGDDERQYEGRGQIGFERAPRLRFGAWHVAASPSQHG